MKLPTDHTDRPRSRQPIQENHQDTKGWSLGLIGASVSWRQNARRSADRLAPGKETGTRACFRGGFPTQRFPAVVRRPGARRATKSPTILSTALRLAPLRLCVIGRMDGSGSICVICGPFRLLKFEAVGESGPEIQVGEIICVYLRDLRFLVGGWICVICGQSGI